MLHSYEQSTPPEMPASDIQLKVDTCSVELSRTGPSLQAVLDAQSSLETLLVMDENWRALQQLLAREKAGEWIDVIESDVLRVHLTSALAAQPAFMAWQFVDAARACLEAAQHAAGDAKASRSSPVIDAAFFTVEPEPTVKSSPDVDLSRQMQTAASRRAPLSELAVGHVLATRIPTLQAHERKGQEKPLAALGTNDRLALSAPPSPEPEILRQPNSVASEPTGDLLARLVPTSVDPTDTIFQTEAAGIREADVEIVIRQPKKQLLDARLPPLPLTNGMQDIRPRPPRTTRTTAVKWIDPNDDAELDYRPVGSALDEAQVSIIATGTKSEAQSRAERRALGVAPDRENQMRRFLTALSGENPK